jgi:uncharacterized membrane protein (DUF2068 family)
MSNVFGLRVVATFEAIKGTLVFAAALGLLSVFHEDLRTVAAEVIGHFYLSPASHAARIFLDAAERFEDIRVQWLAVLAFCYAMLRFVEAYGLWYARRWAEWIAATSCAIYIPLEIVELTRGITWLKLGTFMLNVALCIYMTWKLWSARKIATHS